MPKERSVKTERSGKLHKEANFSMAWLPKKDTYLPVKQCQGSRPLWLACWWQVQFWCLVHLRVARSRSLHLTGLPEVHGNGDQCDPPHVTGNTWRQHTQPEINRLLSSSCRVKVQIKSIHKCCMLKTSHPSALDAKKTLSLWVFRNEEKLHFQ